MEAETTFRLVTPADSIAIDVQPMQRLDGFGEDRWDASKWRDLVMQSDWCEQAIRNGRTVALAGWTRLWPGVVHAYASIACDCGPSMLAVTRRVRQAMHEAKGVRRFQTSVRADFAAGHRWAALLGFEPEGVLSCYGPDGADHILYAKVVRR